MWALILLLILLFFIGLTSSNFAREKLFKWIDSFRWIRITDISPKNKKDPTPDHRDSTEHRTIKRCVADARKMKLKSNVFATFDANNYGFIPKHELMESLRNIGVAMSERDLDDMVRRVDANGDGLIDLDEFCESFDDVVARGAIWEEDGDLKEAFDVFDGDGDGVITVEELSMVLCSLGFKEGEKMEACNEMIRQVDLDGDGTINFVEFMKMMRSGKTLV